MKPGPESQSINFILDFVNVKNWDRQEYRLLEQKYGLVTTRFGERHGYEEFVHLRKFGNRYYFIHGEEADSFKDICCPGGIRNQSLVDKKIIPESDFYNGLVELQSNWKGLLEAVKTKGHDHDFLARIATNAKWQLIQTADVYTPRIGPFLYHASNFDDFLECHYLNSAISHGFLFKKIKTCKNFECGKIFLHNRKDQIYCAQKCRDDFNNKIKIANGTLRRSQAEGRKRDPETYII